MKKDYFKKIVVWKKKPTWGNFILGTLCFLFAGFLLAIYIDMKGGFIIVVFVFSLMFIYGLKLISKSDGEGRKVYYRKVKK